MLKLSNVIGLATVLSILFCFNTSGVCAELQISPQTPNIPAKQQSQCTIQDKNQPAYQQKESPSQFLIKKTDNPENQQNKSDNITNKTTDQGTEFYILFSYRFRITDGLLVLFTAFLVLFTAVLAGVSIWQGCLTKKALVSTQRAFVFLKDIEFKEVRDITEPKEAKWQLFTNWENSGDTPTRNLTISVSCDVFNHELPDDFEFTYDEMKDISMMIGPKANIVIQAIEFPETYIDTLDDIAKIYLRDIYKVYMWGEAKYFDIFNGTSQHSTRFCVELFFTEEIEFISNIKIRKEPIISFNYYKKHNYAD